MGNMTATLIKDFGLDIVIDFIYNTYHQLIGLIIVVVVFIIIYYTLFRSS